MEVVVEVVVLTEIVEEVVVDIVVVLVSVVVAHTNRGIPAKSLSVHSCLLLKLG